VAGLQEIAKLNWSDEKVDNPSWIKALAQVRLIVAREDTTTSTPSRSRLPFAQYAAEKARGNRAYFLN
jgi:hypothetical protein